MKQTNPIIIITTQTKQELNDFIDGISPIYIEKVSEIVNRLPDKFHATIKLNAIPKFRFLYQIGDQTNRGVITARYYQEWVNRNGAIQYDYYYRFGEKSFNQTLVKKTTSKVEISLDQDGKLDFKKLDK